MPKRLSSTHGSYPFVMDSWNGTSLTALVAHASPPDPLWIKGVYDGGDGDDAFEAAASITGRHDGASLVGLRPFLVIIEFVSRASP